MRKKDNMLGFCCCDMHVSECDLIKRTLSTLHHQGQPGVDVVTSLLALGGHRYAGRSQRLAIELRKKEED